MVHSEVKETKLVLVSARKSRGADHWDKDDYDVRLRDGSGLVVGRIMRHPQAPEAQPWFWTITAREQPPSVYNRATQRAANRRWRISKSNGPIDLSKKPLNLSARSRIQLLFAVRCSIGHCLRWHRSVPFSSFLLFGEHELRPHIPREENHGAMAGAGDGGIVESTNLRALGNKIEGFVGINRYLPILDGPLDTPAHRKFLEDASARLKQLDPSGPPPDSFVHSNFEAMNALKLGMQKSNFRGREDTMKLIEALEGLEMPEGDDFPLGEKVLRKEDHQAFNREFIFEMKDGKYKILEIVPKEKTMFPPAGKFA
jgi:hypothetical protein